MFYHSWDSRKGRYVVGLANSKDGFHWKKQGVVFDTVEAGASAGAHDALGATARHVVGGVSRVGLGGGWFKQVGEQGCQQRGTWWVGSGLGGVWGWG